MNEYGPADTLPSAQLGSVAQRMLAQGQMDAASRRYTRQAALQVVLNGMQHYGIAAADLRAAIDAIEAHIGE